MAAGRRGRRRLRRRALLRTVVDELVGKEVHLSRRPAFFFKQKTAYDILAWTGVQTCALPISTLPPPSPRTSPVCATLPPRGRRAPPGWSGRGVRCGPSVRAPRVPDVPSPASLRRA